MNDRIKELEEEWDKEEKTEDEKLDDALFGMERIVYASRSLPFAPGTNVKVVDLEDEKKSK